VGLLPCVRRTYSWQVTGFIIAYVKVRSRIALRAELDLLQSWRLALVLSCIIPAIMILGGGFQRFIAKGKKAQLDLSAAGGTLIEEVLATVRVAYSYGLQKRVVAQYDEKVNIPTEQVRTSRHKRHDVPELLQLGYRMARLQGFSFAGFFFVIYGAVRAPS
jgi:hypothetical protein